jgi:hypothetical protein
MTGNLRTPRCLALIAITVLVSAASVASFAESYRGLFLWAHEHGLTGIWAAGFPLQCDVFIAVGELALFVALADGWPPRSRAAAWIVTALGLAVLVAGNVGHVVGAGFASRASAAVPPLAAAAALAVGLGVLKRVVAMHAAPEPPAPVATVAADAAEAARVALQASIAAGNALSQRALASRFGMTRPAAAKLAKEVATSANGHG